MTKFTKKPKVVNAEQWKGDNFDAIQRLVGSDSALYDSGALTIVLQRGSRFITKGHYIVKETTGDEPLIFSEFNFNMRYSPK